MSKSLRATEFILALLMVVISFITAYKFEQALIIIGAQVVTISYIWSRTNVKKNDGVTKIDNITVRK